MPGPGVGAARGADMQIPVPRPKSCQKNPIADALNSKKSADNPFDNDLTQESFA